MSGPSADRPHARRAPTAHPVLDVLAERWSSRALDPDRLVPRPTLLRLLEAARWAPSSGNAQPWRYLVFDETVPAARERARDCLNRGNTWARAAPVLLLSVVVRTWPGSDEPNRMALHDLGAASLALSLQATEEGLILHQMAGFDLERARDVGRLPSHTDPVAMIAVGYPGDLARLPDSLQRKEQRPRRRRPVAEIAMLERFDGPPLAPLDAMQEAAEAGEDGSPAGRPGSADT